MLPSDGLSANPLFATTDITTIAMAQPTSTQVRLPLPSGTGWEWGVTADFVEIPQPRMGFYWNLPAEAPCMFSSKKAKRCLDRLATHPRRRLAWSDSLVRDRAAALRAKYGSMTQTLLRPTTWEDLYRYFDTVDLWVLGAWNLWRVAHFLCDENEASIARAHSDSAVFNEVDDWAYDWCTHYENRMRLSSWDPSLDILRVLSPVDAEKVRGCSPEALNILRGALKYWYYKYKSWPSEQDTQAARAVSLGYEDMTEGRPSRARARDGTFHFPSLLSIGPGQLTNFIQIMTSRPLRRPAAVWRRTVRGVGQTRCRRHPSTRLQRRHQASSTAQIRPSLLRMEQPRSKSSGRRMFLASQQVPTSDLRGGVITLPSPARFLRSRRVICWPHVVPASRSRALRACRVALCILRYSPGMLLKNRASSIIPLHRLWLTVPPTNTYPLTTGLSAMALVSEFIPEAPATAGTGLCRSVMEMSRSMPATVRAAAACLAVSMSASFTTGTVSTGRRFATFCLGTSVNGAMSRIAS
jgi:hypothetical protein